jgi:hypothetical protein
VCDTGLQWTLGEPQVAVPDERACLVPKPQQYDATRCHLSGAEVPAFRQRVSSVCRAWWYTIHVLRHLLRYARIGESERFALHLANQTVRRCWQESLPAYNVLTYASDAAHAAALRCCRAYVIRPDAAPWSFRASCKPLPSGMG